jgi:transposase
MYPQSAHLEQIPGLGPITALYFVLKIEDPNRFERVRDVGACLVILFLRAAK